MLRSHLRLSLPVGARLAAPESPVVLARRGATCCALIPVGAGFQPASGDLPGLVGNAISIPRAWRMVLLTVVVQPNDLGYYSLLIDHEL